MKLRFVSRYRGHVWRTFVASDRELAQQYGPGVHDPTFAGFTDRNAHTIYVESGQTSDQENEYTTHEWLEAVNDEANIGLTHAQIYALSQELRGIVRFKGGRE